MNPSRISSFELYGSCRVYERNNTALERLKSSGLLNSNMPLVVKEIDLQSYLSYSRNLNSVLKSLNQKKYSADFTEIFQRSEGDLKLYSALTPEECDNCDTKQLKEEYALLAGHVKKEALAARMMISSLGTGRHFINDSSGNVIAEVFIDGGLNLEISRADGAKTIAAFSQEADENCDICRTDAAGGSETLKRKGNNFSRANQNGSQTYCISEGCINKEQQGAAFDDKIKVISYPDGSSEIQQLLYIDENGEEVYHIEYRPSRKEQEDLKTVGDFTKQLGRLLSMAHESGSMSKDYGRYTEAFAGNPQLRQSLSALGALAGIVNGAANVISFTRAFKKGDVGGMVKSGLGLGKELAKTSSNIANVLKDAGLKNQDLLAKLGKVSNVTSRVFGIGGAVASLLTAKDDNYWGKAKAVGTIGKESAKLVKALSSDKVKSIKMAVSKIKDAGKNIAVNFSFKTPLKSLQSAYKTAASVAGSIAHILIPVFTIATTAFGGAENAIEYMKQEGGLTEENKTAIAVGGGIGAVAGEYAGKYLGGMLGGAIGGPVGGVVGSIAGSILGNEIGFRLGAHLGKMAHERMNSGDKSEDKNQENNKNASKTADAG